MAAELTEQVAFRVGKGLKELLDAEVELRRQQGHRACDADVIREALIEYFQKPVPTNPKPEVAG